MRAYQLWPEFLGVSTVFSSLNKDLGLFCACGTEILYMKEIGKLWAIHSRINTNFDL